MPSINKASAKKKNANGKSFCIEARRARKPNKTPLTVKRCIKQDKKTFKFILFSTDQAFFPYCLSKKGLIMSAIEKWHDIMKSGGSNAIEKLDNLLHDDVVFYSPVVFTPQKGKDITKLYLAAASGVFSTDKKTPNSEKEQIMQLPPLEPPNCFCLQ